MLQLLHFVFNSHDVVELLGPTNLLDVIKRVAQILSSFALMLLVVTKTQPAKLISTFPASHMHAALIFLDICLTFGTRFCVDFKPVVGVSFLISADSIKPSLKKIAANRCVRRL